MKVESGKEHLNFLLPEYARGELNNHTLIFTTTYRCNLDCVYCPYKDNNTYGIDLVDNEDKIYSSDYLSSEISFESIDDSLKQIEEKSDREFTNITIHGPGEPLLKWKQIIYLFNRIEDGVKNISKDATLSLMTNGMLLGNDKIYNALFEFKDKITLVINHTGFNELQFKECPKTKLYLKNKTKIIQNIKSFPNKSFKIILSELYAQYLLTPVMSQHKDFDAQNISINIDNNNPSLFKNQNDISFMRFVASLITSWKYCRQNFINFSWSFDCCRDTKTYAHPFTPIQFFSKKEYCDYNILAGVDPNNPGTIQRFVLRDEYYNNVCKQCVAFGKCVPCLFAVDHNTKDQSITNWNDCKSITLIETIFQELEEEYKNRVMEIIKNQNEQTQDSA